LYLGSNSSFLSDINKEFIIEICDILNINTSIINSKDLNLKGNSNERLVDACKKLNADIYVSEPAAKAYLKEDFFTENAISVKWIDYSGYKEYSQMSLPFEHGVSVLDLIFNEGENANIFLKSFNL